jgi:hypothetical protein
MSNVNILNGGMCRSATPDELLEMFGISASHISRACHDILKL